MPYISNVVEKNGFVDSEDTWTMRDNSKKKKFRFYTSGDWYRYKYVIRISNNRTFTVHLRLTLWMGASLIRKQYSCAGAWLHTSQGYAHHDLLRTAPCYCGYTAPRWELACIHQAQGTYGRTRKEQAVTVHGENKKPGELKPAAFTTRKLWIWMWS